MCRTAQIVDLSSNQQTSADNGATRVGKFIVISSKDELQLAYGEIGEFSYHADLVKRFCDVNNIPSGWHKKPDLYEIYGNDYQLRGGGWIEENQGERLLKIYGYSTAYGRFKSEDILYLLERAQKFADYEIALED